MYGRWGGISGRLLGNPPQRVIPLSILPGVRNLYFRKFYTACKFPSVPLRHCAEERPEFTNSVTHLPSCAWPFALGWKDSWAMWMPMASRPPVTHAHGSTVMRFCHSVAELP